MCVYFRTKFQVSNKFKLFQLKTSGQVMREVKGESFKFEDITNISLLRHAQNFAERFIYVPNWSRNTFINISSSN